MLGRSKGCIHTNISDGDIAQSQFPAEAVNGEDSESTEEPLSHGSKKLRIIYTLDDGPLSKMSLPRAVV